MSAWRNPLLLALLIPATGCGVTPDYELPVEAAPPVPSQTRIAEEVGRLLGPDRRVSEAAAARLRALPETERQALVAYQQVIPRERDPRWLSVLESVGGLPALSPSERFDYARWVARQDGELGPVRAQSHLLQVLRESPNLMLDALAQGGPDDDLLAITVGVAGYRPAVPVLVRRYREAMNPNERSSFAAALGQLAGPELAPRADGSATDLERDARRIERWFGESAGTRNQGTVPAGRRDG